MSEYPPYYAYPSTPVLTRALPNPPRLHWGWVLALGIITFGFFSIVWLFVQAVWVKKVTGSSKAFGWTLAYLLYVPAMFVMGIVAGITAVMAHGDVEAATSGLVVFARISGFVLYLCAAYTLKSGLESAPINIPLGGVMTFFFSAIYFQYFLHDFEWQPEVGVQINPAMPPHVMQAPLMGYREPLAPPPPPPPYDRR